MMIAWGVRRLLILGMLAFLLVVLSIGMGAWRAHPMVSFVANEDDQTDIHLYDPIRQDRINITASTAPEWAFGWSQAGALLFTASVNNRQASDELFVMMRPGDARLINTPDTLYSFGGVWSPDGRTLAYFSSHPTNVSDLYTVTFPQMTVRNLTQTPTLSESNPLWSPDGASLLYRLDDNLHLLDVATDDTRLLVDMPDPIESPVWAPDGEQIIFYTRNWQDGRTSLTAYRIGRSGAGLTRLPLPEPISSDVTWSPDSTQIALIVERDTLLLYHLEQDQMRRIAGTGIARTAPSWSPDGRWLAFLEDRQLVLYDLHRERFQYTTLNGRVRPPLLWQPLRH
ncbi:MAG: hypothetical protein ACFE0Q_05030 [Anaerolineae bacterium]